VNPWPAFAISAALALFATLWLFWIEQKQNAVEDAERQAQADRVAEVMRRVDEWEARKREARLLRESRTRMRQVDAAIEERKAR
jgi:hypothetical protein